MERPYIIEYASNIEDKLNDLPKSIRERIKSAIDKKLKTDPITFGKPLQYSKKGMRRLRVGDYRVIYKIYEDKILVLIIDIDHRKDVYE